MPRGEAEKRPNLDNGEEPIVLPVRQPGPAAQPAVPAAEYEFLQCTGDFKPVDVASRRLIRSHVMKNYFQEKRNQANTLSSASSASTVNSRDKLKGRWRLGTAKQQEDGQPLPQRRGSKASASSRKNSQQINQDADAPRATTELLDPSEAHRRASTSQIEHLMRRNTLLEQFEAHRIDPFNALPIQTGKRVDRLMNFCTLFVISLTPPPYERSFVAGAMVAASGRIEILMKIQESGSEIVVH
jgi:hypothetical protein